MTYPYAPVPAGRSGSAVLAGALVGGVVVGVVRADTIVVGTDCTSVDSWCVVKLLEKPRDQILYLDKVIARGLGQDWRPQWTQEITV